MEVLADPEIANIITWLPHGKGFIILQKRKFSINVMPCDDIPYSMAATRRYTILDDSNRTSAATTQQHIFNRQ